jgi:chemotaxis protein CheD
MPTQAEDSAALPSHYLHPGNVFAPAQPHQVTTVLGSCIAVCLWDRQLRIGGINHYLLPLWNGEGLPTPRYGNVAIPLLIDKLLEHGGLQSRMVAKIFGGATMWQTHDNAYSVGERNISFARRFLAELKIPVQGADVGGDFGRKIIFETGSGVVLLRRNRGRLEEENPVTPSAPNRNGEL